MEYCSRTIPTSTLHRKSRTSAQGFPTGLSPPPDAAVAAKVREGTFLAQITAAIANMLVTRVSKSLRILEKSMMMMILMVRGLRSKHS